MIVLSNNKWEEQVEENQRIIPQPKRDPPEARIHLHQEEAPLIEVVIKCIVINPSCLARKRDEKRDDKKNGHDLRSRQRSPSDAKSIDSAVPINGSIVPADDPGAFENFPEIHQKTVEGLKKRGINFLFPVQYETFYPIYKRNDLIVRDLTGSGKTLGFSLPMVEYLRKNKCFGTGKI